MISKRWSAFAKRKVSMFSGKVTRLLLSSSRRHFSCIQLHRNLYGLITQVFHWTTFPVEMFLTFLRTFDLRLLIHCIYVSVVVIVTYGLLGYKMGLNATFGDGTHINIMEMHEIRTAVHKHMVYSRWELGDILCIDNFAVSHGRQPTNDHGRKVVVAWSHALKKANMLTSESHVLVADDLKVLENPQERTPESTLNSEDAETLKATVIENHHQSSRAGSGVDAAELKATLSKQTVSSKSISGHHKRARSQPVLLSHSSDFWKEVN